jgi:murein DD-endopeptidase MepM/ murein hydrolase activator NlpD
VESSKPEVEFTRRRSSLRKKLRRPEVAQTPAPTKRRTTEVTQTPAPTRRRTTEVTQTPAPTRRRVKVETPEPVVQSSRENVQSETGIRRLRARVAATRKVPVVIQEVTEQSQPVVVAPDQKPTLAAQQATPTNLEPVEITAPPKAPETETATATESKDYNNSYIDPTNYDQKTANEAPTVVLTNRSNGCNGISCTKAPITSSRSGNRLADSNKTRYTAPSWIRKSQNTQLASIAPVRRALPNVNNTSLPLPTKKVVASNISKPVWRPARVTYNNVSSVRKSEYRSNRFITNNFAPAPRITTTASSVPVAPSAGVLPLPMTAENAAPRPSTVAYNIPLESTLPKIAFNGGSYSYGGGTGLIFPVSVPSPITSLFGWRIHPITGDRRFHSGTDIGAAMGTPVLAAYTGQVQVADYVGGYGLTVILNHNSAQQTLYGHMSEVFVQPGQWVEQGTVIGRVGSTGNSTGPHLHFEVRQLTPEGWVATDPNGQLQYALNQLVNVFQTAQRAGE